LELIAGIIGSTVRKGDVRVQILLLTSFPPHVLLMKDLV